MAGTGTQTSSSGIAESPCSHLPADILGMISKRLDDAVGNLRLRSVCSTWRSAVPLSKRALHISFKKGFPTFIDPNRRGHFSLSSSTVYLLRPAAGAAEGNDCQIFPWWLLRVEGKDGFRKFRPLSPFSRIFTVLMKDHFPKGFPRGVNLLDVQIHEIRKAYSLDFVEDGKKIENNLLQTRARKVVVSSSQWSANSGDGEGFYAVLGLFRAKLGFIKSNDEKWSQIEDTGRCVYDDILYSEVKGVFYAVDISGRLVMIDRDLKAKEVVYGFGFSGCQKRHLIESNGDLFMVVEYDEPELYMSDGEDAFEIDDYSFKYTNLEFPLHLKVFKLSKNEWEYVPSLGDQVFFIGDDCSYVVSAQRFGLKGNCVYFTADDFMDENESDLTIGNICPDAGVFCLEDGRCASLASSPEHAQLFLNCPVWLKSPPKTKSKAKRKGSKK
ncbi:unnamed protein product [Cuscuta campestris]|uniref:KIB1-4 beta-propeller domain-containing protein n=1 Tax=Cuscuta campestris TaxID=132261 RepID=A0A484LBH9_9ASTE|nr:unnamed protein product [Cuscuta campestris]